MQKIESLIKKTLEEATRIRDKIKYIENDSSRVMIHNACGGGHYLKDLKLYDLDKTVKAMALSTLAGKLEEVESKISTMAKSIGLEKDSVT